MDKVEKTKESYGFLWAKNKGTTPVCKWHFNAMQEAIDIPIVTGKFGLDAGSGCGYDTYLMAKNSPSVSIVSMDISDGIYETKAITSALTNVHVVKGSVLDIPVKNEVFDFAYSFGVLHHTPEPKKGLLEISRVLKKDKPVFLYLYEDHSENSVKRAVLKIINAIRRITVKMPPAVLYVLCFAASPFIFIIFSLPAKIFRKFRSTRGLAEKIPFNFGRGLFSLKKDLYDRFSAPIEHRYGRRGVYDMFSECGFRDIMITRLKDTAGWVAWGCKK